MRLNRTSAIVLFFACGLITLAVHLALKRPTAGIGSIDRERVKRIEKSPDTVTKPKSPETSSDRVTSALRKLLDGMQGTDTADFGKIAKGFAESGFSGLEPKEMLRVIVSVDFGSSDEDGQVRGFLLDSAVETLRDRASEADVHWVAERLREATRDHEIAKWLKVLDLMGREENQAAYIALLNDLPRGEPEPKMKAGAQVVGRVLGGIAS